MGALEYGPDLFNGGRFRNGAVDEVEIYREPGPVQGCGLRTWGFISRKQERQKTGRPCDG